MIDKKLEATIKRLMEPNRENVTELSEIDRGLARLLAKLVPAEPKPEPAKAMPAPTKYKGKPDLRIVDK